MKSYQLKVAEHEEGTYTEEQISQLYADGRVDRHTQCRIAGKGDWKTVDDYLPMLKYGTHLPPPTLPAKTSPAASVPPIPPTTQRVTLIDIDLPFASIVRLLFKWTAAGLVVGICLIPVLIILWFVFLAVLALFFGGTFSFLHRP